MPIPGAHTASSHKSDIVCRECHKPGHKRGDPACQQPGTLPEVPDNAIQDSVPTDNASDASPPAPAPLSQDAEQDPNNNYSYTLPTADPIQPAFIAVNPGLPPHKILFSGEKTTYLPCRRSKAR